ncbi:hypothetical protein [Bradyrhizobium sp. CER78]|uniref:hypothetical protein n=1 Tax=Bradyrhizobium sp. CER78 TaxID=3039162 RepID=UPI00244A3527|nr:hypothetical protein [Bradyrhizobium sp. CER78]MDH2384646.1 hypothetical protein [Bradyrhizobium sp. CER78]
MGENARIVLSADGVAERDRLFERLLDDSKWTTLEQGAATAAKPSRATAARAASASRATKSASARKRS